METAQNQHQSSYFTSGHVQILLMLYLAYGQGRMKEKGTLVALSFLFLLCHFLKCKWHGKLTYIRKVMMRFFGCSYLLDAIAFCVRGKFLFENEVLLGLSACLFIQ